MIKDVKKLESVNGMYKHGRGTLKHMHKLELDKNDQYTLLISTQGYSMILN